jgi:TolA-binding protein
MTFRSTLVSRGVRFMPLAALVAAGGCFATRNDVRVVQADLANVRTEMLKADAELKATLTQAIRTLAISNDSIREMSNRLTSVSGDVRAGLRSVNEQLILVQQLLNQNVQVLERYKRELDKPTYGPPVVTPPVAGIPMTGADSLTATQPSANPGMTAGQLYLTARNNLTRGAWSTARMTFQELVDKYPNHADAPNAQLGIAQSFDGENNKPAAMTAYQAVIQKYGDAPASATARYKLALAYIAQQKNADAIPLLQAIVDKFKTSNEYELAKSQLEVIKRPE